MFPKCTAGTEHSHRTEQQLVKMSMSKLCTEQELRTEQGNPVLGVYSVYSSESTEQEKYQFIVH